MADAKISALSAVSAVAGANEIPVNESGTTKKATVNQLETYLQTQGMPRVWALGTDHAISSTTATEITGLGPVTLEAGTYTFKYTLMVQSATTTVGLKFGINFTGTAAKKVFQLRYPGTGTTANTGVADDVGALGGQLQESFPSKSYTTTAPDMGYTGGVATANSDILNIIEGLLIVTASGDLELWHSSETATSTTVLAGSSLVLHRTA